MVAEVEQANRTRIVPSVSFRDSGLMAAARACHGSGREGHPEYRRNLIEFRTSTKKSA